MGRLELETKINRIGSKLVKAGKIVAGKTKDFVRGYTLKDETAVRRIISDPKTISPADIEKYRKEQIDSTVLLIPSGSIMSNLSAIAMFKEQDRLEKLTPEELGLEVLRSAETKAKLWKLILNA